MRVLITGGYGFIGSHIAEKFHKEGYEVHILDRLASGDATNVSFKHKSYSLHIEDIKCQQVFASYQFDVVIHVADQLNETHLVEHVALDAQANIVGLANILQLAQTYGVSKFIYASSIDVYGALQQPTITEELMPAPTSSYGISKLAAELYCQQFAQHHTLDVIILRLSDVYGPGQPTQHVLARYLHDAMHYQPICISTAEKSSYDFIYIQDVVHAFYNAAQAVTTGIYNLSSGVSYTPLEVATHVAALPITCEVKEQPAGASAIPFHTYQNDKIKRDFDWVPFYTLAQGLEKTYEWAAQRHDIARAASQKQKQRPALPKWPNTKPFLENILLFTVLSLLLLVFPIPIVNTFIFGIFYIMIIGSFYGNRQGFVAVVLSVVLVLAEHLLNGREFFSLLYDTTFLFQISTFLFVGLVVGYSVQRKNLKIEAQQEQLDDLQKRYTFLENVHTEMREIKDELQYRLRNNEDSFGKIYSIIKELDNLEPEKIFTKTVQVVEKIMRCQGVSIYAFNRYHSFLRLVAHSDKEQQHTIPNSIKVDSASYVQSMMETGKPFINYTLQPDAPLMAAPIYYDNDLRAIITIQKLPFQSFSTYYENLFIVVKELIQSALGRAFEFIKLSEQQRYIDQTAILHYPIFEEIVQTKKEAKETFNMPYMILTLPTTEQQLVEQSEQITRLLRETDYISYKQNMLYILLSNVQETDLPFIFKRFNEKGFVFNEQTQVVS